MVAFLAAAGLGGFVILIGWLWRADARAARREAAGGKDGVGGSPILAEPSDPAGDAGPSDAGPSDAGGCDAGGGGSD